MQELEAGSGVEPAGQVKQVLVARLQVRQPGAIDWQLKQVPSGVSFQPSRVLQVVHF